MRTRLILALVMVVIASSCYKAYDFDGDGNADVVWMTRDGTWYHDTSTGPPRRTATPSVLATSAGASSIPVPGNYDGGAKPTPGVVLNVAGGTSSSWVTNGTAGTITFAAPAAQAGANALTQLIVPVPAAYDGGSKTIPAWYRDSDATWYIQGEDPIQFGSGPSAGSSSDTGNLSDFDQDVPVPADYDGDGTADLAVYNPRTGIWHIRSSKTLAVTTTTLGGPGWYPAPGDYDGVHHAQVAVFDALDPVTATLGTFEVQNDTPWVPDSFGLSSSQIAVPTPADYDGDGKADFSFLTDIDGQSPIWYIDPSSAGIPGPGATQLTMPNTPIEPAETPAALIAEIARITLVHHVMCEPLGQPAVC